MTTKILIRAPNWLGDVVMMLPALGIIRQRYPQASISVLGQETFRSLLSGHPFINEFIAIKSPKTMYRLRTFYDLTRKLRQRKFDKGYLFSNSFSTALEMFFARARERTGFNRYGRKFLLTHPVRFESCDWDNKHHTLYYLRLVGEEKLSREVPQIFLGSEAKKQAESVLKQAKILSRPLIGLVPGAAYGPAKRWPEKNFSDLIEKILERCPAHILLFGTHAEKNITQNIGKRFQGKILDLSGKTNLALLAALAAECDAMVCNDSGVAHLSAALGVRTCVIFGSSSPAETAPLGSAVKVFYAGVKCSPCFRRTCPLPGNRYQCLAAITPDMVFAHIEGILHN